MNTTQQTTITNSLPHLYQVTNIISEKTAALEKAVAQKQLRFQQIYNHLSQSLPKLCDDPEIYPLYKHSVNLLYSIYQTELTKRALKPDLTTIQQWVRIVRRLMNQEITGKYLQNYDVFSTTESNQTLLQHTFTASLLNSLTNLLPFRVAVEPTQSKNIPLYSDYFDSFALH